MTFNVRTSNIDDGENAWDHRKALVVDTILSQAPQVLGFQEALADQLEYYRRLFQNTNGSESIVVLTAVPA